MYMEDADGMMSIDDIRTMTEKRLMDIAMLHWIGKALPQGFSAHADMSELGRAVMRLAPASLQSPKFHELWATCTGRACSRQPELQICTKS